MFKVTKVDSKQTSDNFSDYWIFNWLTTGILIKKQYQGDKNNLGDRVFPLITIQFNKHLLNIYNMPGIHTPRLRRLVFDVAGLRYELWIIDYITEKLL